MGDRRLWPGFHLAWRSDAPPLSAPTQQGGQQGGGAHLLAAYSERGFFYCQRNTGLLIKVGEGLFWASPGPHPKRSLGAAGGLLGPS